MQWLILKLREVMPPGNGITEIGIVIHDGVKVLNFYETLVNPHVPIPYFIQRLTGIDNNMVANAPAFSEIAAHVYELLQDKVFVAHNVNFDYSFVKHHLQVAGYELDTKKTVHSEARAQSAART